MAAEAGNLHKREEGAIMEHKKSWELNDAQLGDVSGGLLDGLLGWTSEPTAEAQARGLVAV